MKKMLCFLLCLTLIFSSVSLCFASPTTWDTSDQTNLRYIMQSVTSNTSGNLYYIVNNIYSRMNTINNNLVDIKGLLSNSGESISYWVHSISTWMSPIYNSIVNIPVDLTSIRAGLWKPLDNGSSQAYLDIIDKRFGLDSYPSYYQSNPNSAVRYYYYNGDTVQVDTYTPLSTPILGSLMLHLWGINRSVANMAEVQLKNSTTQQTYTDWTTLSSSTFTPVSSFDALNKWLSKIQSPVARLSYVLASDERIEAQEAAAANEEAVVDNFIDSSGDGSASPSDIGSVSDLSSGYKQNFGSDASVSGIFNIFDSNNMGWFSQETKNQLDTTTPTRLTKDSESETPLLDKQLKDIYNALGVKQP